MAAVGVSDTSVTPIVTLARARTDRLIPLANAQISTLDGAARAQMSLLRTHVASLAAKLPWSPLSALLAIEPGTKLWVFPNGCEAEEDAFLATIEVGEVMVWRGDLVHAGAGYAVEHTRIHAYVDPPASVYARPTGKTNLCRAGECNV